MGWYISPLPRCSAWGCQKPATEQLFNAVNARSGVYCHPCAGEALKRAQEEYEPAQPTGAVKE